MADIADRIADKNVRHFIHNEAILSTMSAICPQNVRYLPFCPLFVRYLSAILSAIALIADKNARYLSAICPQNVRYFVPNIKKPGFLILIGAGSALTGIGPLCTYYKE